MDAPVTTMLCVVTCVVTIIAFQKPMVLERLLFRPFDILVRRQYERMGSSALIHANAGHLILNMIGLFSFGTNLEAQCGASFLLVIYGASVVGGSLLSLWLHRNESYSALGASGGVCGIIFTHVFLFPGSGVGFLLLPFAMPGWLYAIGFIVISVVGIHRGSDGIGHDAHLGGAIIGLLVATLYYPQIITASPVLYATVMITSAVLVYVFVRRPILSDILSVKAFRDQYRPSERYQRYDEARERTKHREELDQLLDKVSAKGLHALTDRERKRIEELSKRI